MNSNIPDIANQFAKFCMAAYDINPRYCPLANASINSSDPVAGIVDRMNGVMDQLAQIPGSVFVGSENFSYSFVTLQSYVFRMGNPGYVNDWAELCLGLETALEGQSDNASLTKRDTDSFLFSSFKPGNSPFAGYGNPFTNFLIACIDADFPNINNTDAVVNYISKLINKNLLIGYQDLWTSPTASCPDLSPHNVEKLPTQFPTRINTNIVVVARTSALGYPMNAAVNAYNFIGSENAVILVRDAYGPSQLTENGVLDECTMNVFKEYFRKGKRLVIRCLELGQIPPNGTICRTDYSGMNNIFVANYASFMGTPNSNYKWDIELGVGLGMGLLVLGICIALSVGY